MLRITVKRARRIIMREMIQRLSCILLGIAVLLSWGCGPRPPGDYPKTFPCSILITKSGVPLEGATVTLSTTTLPAGLVCMAITNDAGIADVTTLYANFSRNGAPRADYVVAVFKEPYLPDEKSKAEIASLSYTEFNAYQAKRQKQKAAMPLPVPKVLHSPVTSPIDWSFTGTGERLTIDVDEYANPAK